MEEPDKKDKLNTSPEAIIPPTEKKKRKSRTRKSKNKTNPTEEGSKEVTKEETAKEKVSEKTATSEAVVKDVPDVKKKKNRKRKNKKTTAKRHDAAGGETESTPQVLVKSQTVEEFNYQELEKEFASSTELSNPLSILFTPEKKNKTVEISKTYNTAKSEEPKAKFGYKGNNTAAHGKGRYSAVPPPQSLLTASVDKYKKKPHREGYSEEKQENRVEKEVRKTGDEEFKILTPSVKLPSKKHKKKTIVKEEFINQPTVKFVKASDPALKSDRKPTVLDQSTRQATLTNRVVKTISVDENTKKKDVHTSEYCHRDDILYGRARPKFDKYLDPKICEKYIAEKNSNTYMGVIRVNKRNPKEAYVTTDKLEADILIFGSRDRNRAFDGDTVYVKLIDLETVWDRKKESMAQKRKDQNKQEAEIGDEKLKPKYTGKIIAIHSSAKDRMVSGTIYVSKESAFSNKKISDDTVEEDIAEFSDDAKEDSPNNSVSKDSVKENEPTGKNAKNGKKQNSSFLFFLPNDKRIPYISIQIKRGPTDFLENAEKYAKMLVVVKIQKWTISNINPEGSFVRELGHIGNIPAETDAILSDNNISELPFTNKALKGLPPTPWSIEQSQIKKRRDLRETRIFTIDPATAKDLDDAVHITKLAENDFEVGVHIADVSHFVKQHTSLDHEAFDRGTSTYLCDRVIPMLPSLLCEELCSLNPGVDRLAFSVIWKMDREGKIKDTWFGKTVIRSCGKLAYEDAQSVIEGHGLPKTVKVVDHKNSEVEQDIKYLFEMSKNMRKRRFANGALSINSIKLSFKLNEIGEPCEVSIYEQKDSNRLIEEFMLRANMSVAEKIHEHYPDEALLRQHSPPHEKSLDEFIRIADNLGYKFDGSSAASLQESFNAIESKDAQEVLKLLAVKPMQRAKYFCTGSCEEEKFRHYALNVPFYTHFTSPIRRFPDILVHRQLEAAISGAKTCGYKTDDIQKAASHCNDRKEAAKNSQDSNLNLYLYHYLYNMGKELGRDVICTAIVTQVLKDSFDILISEYGIEKRIYMDSMPISKHVYDEEKKNQSVYWKENIDSSYEWDQKRRNEKNGVETIDKKIYLEKDGSVKIPKELLVENTLDKENRMQRFDTFSKLNVRIQVNVERSPPIANVYPINPFM